MKRNQKQKEFKSNLPSWIIIWSTTDKTSYSLSAHRSKQFRLKTKYIIAAWGFIGYRLPRGLSIVSITINNYPPVSLSAYHSKKPDTIDSFCFQESLPTDYSRALSKVTITMNKNPPIAYQLLQRRVTPNNAKSCYHHENRILSPSIAVGWWNV